MLGFPVIVPTKQVCHPQPKKRPVDEAYRPIIDTRVGALSSDDTDVGVLKHLRGQPVSHIHAYVTVLLSPGGKKLALGA
jgi:hypothetical protein